jgi:hypothetical protein
MQIKMSMEHWWNDADRGKERYWEKKPVTLPLCSPHKTALPGIEPGRPN